MGLCIYAETFASVQMSVWTFVGIFFECVHSVVVCVCIHILLFVLLLSICEGTHTHTSFDSLGGLAAYYESLVGKGGENKRLTTLKWQQTAERFTSLIPAHRDLKELSM